MDCKTVREKLSPFLEGLLSPDEKTPLENHLESCARCRTALEDLKKTGELVRTLEEVEPPPWLTQKIMSRLGERERSGGLLKKLFYPLHVKVPLQAVAAVFIAVIAVYVFKAVEPEMKQAGLPAAPAPVVTREGEPKPSPPEAGPQAPRGTALEEGPERDRSTASPAPPAVSAETAKEGRPSLPTVPERAPVEKKAEPSPGTKEETSGSAGGLRKQELSPEAKSSPPVAPRERESLSRQDAAREPRKLKSSAVPSRAGKIAGAKTASVSAAVRTPDPDAAAGEVERLLGRLGARKVERQSRDRDQILTAELQAGKAAEFVEGLKALGKVEGGILPEFSEGDLSVRVELLENPKP